ncbi:MAG: hypothetical protein KBT29_07920 [Prevotellaceae bacterium]|nr:hypothetical protein [Candidatus Minthosoma caballi]
MQRILSTLLIIIFQFAFFVIHSAAQPKFAGKVQKGIFSINTYDKQNNLIHQGTGFYVGQNGEAVASYAVFKNAAKATVIDAAGKQYDVDCVLGADDTYSLVRFRVATKGNAVLNTSSAAQSKGTTMYALGFSNSGTAQSDVSAVSDTVMIDGKYVYYALGKVMDEKLIGAPVFNADGTLVGIMHAPIGEKSYVLDIRFREVLKMEAIPTRSASVALGNIFLPKGLPDTAEEALVYTYFHSRTTSNEEYMGMMNRFVTTFPQNAEGYLRRATPLIDMLRFDEADADLQKYMSLVEDKASGNYNTASTIFNKLNILPEPEYSKWTYDLVLDYVNKAISLNDAKSDAPEEKKVHDTQYKILKAQALMGKKNYDEAIGIYESLNVGADRNAAYFYAISTAREERGDSAGAVVEMLDSAIAQFSEPMPREAANYVLRRGQILANCGRYRDAVKDYNQYCYLMNNQVSAVFHYERYQIESNARLFQQALDDINSAIEKAPRVPLYYVEKASLCIRVNMLDECIEACQMAIALSPDIIDSYRILGYAQLQKGDKATARQNIQKAIDMGDENAKTILEKYF